MPSNRQQILEEQVPRYYRWHHTSQKGRRQVAASIKEEDDALLWEQTSAGRSSPEASELAEAREALGEPDSAFWGEPEADGEPEPSRNGAWEQTISREEQAHLDEEAREFAYGFGANEARDVLNASISTAEDEDEQQEAQAAVDGPVSGKGKKGRKRNERRGGRPKDSSIPLHMLPKVRLLSVLLSSRYS